MEWQDHLNTIWAKSASEGEQGESLATHTKNVISVLSRIRNRSPFLPTLINDSQMWLCCFWSCLLHDFGKAAQGFQLSIRREGPRWNHRHEILSLAFIPWVTSLSSEEFPWIAACIASHHRDAQEILQERYNPMADIEELQINETIREINEETQCALWHWIGDDAAKLIRAYGFADNASTDWKPQNGHSINADTIYCALKSYNNLFRNLQRESAHSARNQRALILRGLLMQADHLASAHAPQLESVKLPDTTTLAAKMGIQVKSLRSHQIAASMATGSIVLSAPTGSGKTEASLLWASNQQKQSESNRHLIYILPYQASLNAIHRRLGELLNCQIALLHGRSVETLYRNMLNKGYTKAESLRNARFADNLARLHSPPIWCTTLYQLLRAAYRLPGYEALWTCMAGALVIVDEVHAYEPARLGMFIELLRELKERWGIEICTMTATMPSWLRELLLSSFGSHDLDIDATLFQAFTRHRVEIREGEILDEKALAFIVDEVKGGRSILVGTNTVGTAQKVYGKLKKSMMDSQVMLLHSRFNAVDRLSKENRIQEILGATKKQSHPLAVVATQVIEVSLDLDFDTILTEPAPLEALIQRFGRVNRSGRKAITPVRVLTKSIGDTKVYDQELTRRSLSILKENANQEINELNVNGWLDSIYGDDLKSRFVDEISHHRKEFRASCLNVLKAFNRDEELASLFDELFDGTEVLPSQFLDEYRSIDQILPLEARSLLVPLSYRNLKRFIGHNLASWNNELKLCVVDKHYDSEIGLALQTLPDEE